MWKLPTWYLAFFFFYFFVGMYHEYAWVFIGWATVYYWFIYNKILKPLLVAVQSLFFRLWSLCTRKRVDYGQRISLPGKLVR